jgi:hypothetical protein
MSEGKKCDIDMFQGFPGASFCMPCGNGDTTYGQDGQTACNVKPVTCKPGTYRKSSKCERCPDGEYQSEHDAAKCNRCTSGQQPDATQTTCEDINLCADNPCKNGAVCESQSDRYNCNCPVGYEGVHCETKTDVCSPGNPCKNSGVCENLGELKYKCTCRYSFFGENCEKQLDADCCVKADVRITGGSEGLKRKTAISAGVYTLKGEVNSNAYWVNDNGKMAIWYVPTTKQWKIGRLGDKGKKSLGYLHIATKPNADARCPFYEEYSYLEYGKWYNGAFSLICKQKENDEKTEEADPLSTSDLNRLDNLIKELGGN